MEPRDQDLISSHISHTDRVHPASPGAPDLSPSGIPVLAGRPVSAVIRQKHLGRRRAGTPLLAASLRAPSARGCPLPRPAPPPSPYSLRPPGQGPATEAGSSKRVTGVELPSPAGGRARRPQPLVFANGLRAAEGGCFVFFSKRGNRLLLCTSLKPK